MNVSGKRVLLTGATGGLGHAIARELAGAGAHVILSGRRADVLAASPRSLRRVAPADLTDRDAVRALAAAHTDVDVLVSNAGLSASGRSTRGPRSRSTARWTSTCARRSSSPDARAAHGRARRGPRRPHVLARRQDADGGVAALQRDEVRAARLRGRDARRLHGTGVGVSAIFPGFIRDAGMFHVTGVKLPFGVGTKSPRHVALATRKAIERNKAELDVAPVGLRARRRPRPARARHRGGGQPALGRRRDRQGARGRAHGQPLDEPRARTPSHPESVSHPPGR